MTTLRTMNRRKRRHALHLEVKDWAKLKAHRARYGAEWHRFRVRNIYRMGGVEFGAHVIVGF